MECKAITNTGTQCSREAETNSKYCWQHRNYDIKENITTQYFENTPLLQNTLLSYFSTEKELKKVNKKFNTLDYEKYNTHLQPHGIEETYYPETKTIKEKTTYINGVRNGLSKQYYDNGQLEIIINYKNGKKDGLSEYWFKSGKFSGIRNYKNGKLDGLLEEWYENGILYGKGYYKNNKRDGLFETRYINGQLEDRINYKNGKFNGLFEEWYDNGQLSLRCYYKNGKLNGLYEEWYETGDLAVQRNYKNGIQV